MEGEFTSTIYFSSHLPVTTPKNLHEDQIEILIIHQKRFIKYTTSARYKRYI